MKNWLLGTTALAAALYMAPASAGPPDEGTGGVLAVHGERTIERTTHLSRLALAPGAALRAPDGHMLTLTVNGIGTPIAPGTYKGAVVLTVTDDIPVQYKALPPHHYRAAVYVDDGHRVGGKSVAAAALGRVTDSRADDVRITSNEEMFNGILVTGNSRYVINDPVIRMMGNGGNDFAGYGAAIMSSGHADVTVNRARITTTGAVRTGIFVGGNSVMHVNDSFIDVHNGKLPSDYKFTIEVGKMKEVPWMLGLKGNVRATNLVDSGTVYYTRSHIRAQGWGALSTDDSKRVRMYVKDSLIETVESGYGAYSIGDSLDHFSHSTFNVADVALIMAAQGSGTFTDGTVVNSRRFGVMMHSGGDGGTLTIDKKSVFNTKSTAIQVKGRGNDIIVDDAQIHAGNGIILQAMLNDDPFAAGAGPIVGVQGPGGAGAPPPGAPPAAGPGGGPDGMPPMKPHAPVRATFRNTTLAGDMINSRTAQGDMSVALENARLTGAISTATQAPISGKAPTQETYYLIGEVTNTFGPSHDDYGLSVNVDGRSSWTVTRTSYLTRLHIAPGAHVVAPVGSTLELLIDGTVHPLAEGEYRGNIELRIRKS